MIFIDMTGIKCFLKLERNMYSFDVSLCKIDEFWVCSRGKSSIGVGNQNCQSEQNQSCLHKALVENTRHLMTFHPGASDIGHLKPVHPPCHQLSVNAGQVVAAHPQPLQLELGLLLLPQIGKDCLALFRGQLC